MSREEHLRELVRQGQALRQEDIDLGAKQEQERIKTLAEEWISEMRGHDGECNCRHNANILQQFIQNPEFTQETK